MKRSNIVRQARLYGCWAPLGAQRTSRSVVRTKSYCLALKTKPHDFKLVQHRRQASMPWTFLYGAIHKPKFCAKPQPASISIKSKRKQLLVVYSLQPQPKLARRHKIHMPSSACNGSRGPVLFSVARERLARQVQEINICFEQYRVWHAPSFFVGKQVISRGTRHDALCFFDFKG